jgi:hypothetical protein
MRAKRKVDQLAGIQAGPDEAERGEFESTLRGFALAVVQSAAKNLIAGSSRHPSGDRH